MHFIVDTVATWQNFCGFREFSADCKIFPLNHLLCTVHDGHGLMHLESFLENSVFCTQPRKFSHSKVLPYTIVCILDSCITCQYH